MAGIFDNAQVLEGIRMLEENDISHTKILVKYDYLKGLNYEQTIAATRLEGNYLVIAGPGAGKTHTLLYRIIHMVNMGIAAQEICIVTFTRKAANQLKYRIRRLIPEIELGYIGTIHGLAMMLITRNSGNKLRIIDPEDDLMVLKLSMEEAKLQAPKGIKLRTVQKIIDYSSVTMKTIAETLIDLNKEEINAEDIEQIRKIYEKYKSDNGYMNYSDVILQVPGADRGSLNYIMIDEFQDTDPSQLAMIKRLQFPNVMAIGDDFQSIYGFRGADNTIILSFALEFKNAKAIKLRKNYRSTPEIVEFENIVTSDTDYGYKKELVAERKSSEKSAIIMEANLDYIWERIQIVHDSSSKNRLAFIYRYNRAKDLIEKKLIEEKIDYVVYGGRKLLERKHVKDIFSMLLTNRNKNDFVSYLRTLTLLEGIGEVTAKKLIQTDLQSFRTDLQQLREILYAKDFTIKSLLNQMETFYLSLESVLVKSNYTKEEIKEDFEIINLLADNYTDITNFVNDIILDSNQDKWSTPDKRAQIVLTTIHSAKGLEFEEVHFYYDPKRVFSVEEAEENRRLFYTAISRAKNQLVIHDGWGRTDIEEVIKDFNMETNQILNRNIYKNDWAIDTKEAPLIKDKEIQKRDVFNFILEVTENVSPEKIKNLQENMVEVINSIPNPNQRNLLKTLEIATASEDKIVFIYNVNAWDDTDITTIENVLDDIIFLSSKRFVKTLIISEKNFQEVINEISREVDSDLIGSSDNKPEFYIEGTDDPVNSYQHDPVDNSHENLQTPSELKVESHQSLTKVISEKSLTVDDIQSVEVEENKDIRTYTLNGEEQVTRITYETDTNETDKIIDAEDQGGDFPRVNKGTKENERLKNEPFNNFKKVIKLLKGFGKRK